MWLVPIGFGVGVLAGKATGKTWTSSVVYAGAVTWTTSQVYGLAIGRAGALGRLAYAGQALWGMTVGGLITGVAVGIAGGIGTSRLLFGKEGQEDAIDFYTGKVSVPLYIETLKKAPERIAARIQANRAVENNAAGLPTGSNVTYGDHAQRMADSHGMTRDQWLENIYSS
jgi:hypothetical protein